MNGRTTRVSQKASAKNKGTEKRAGEALRSNPGIEIEYSLVLATQTARENASEEASNAFPELPHATEQEKCWSVLRKVAPLQDACKSAIHSRCESVSSEG
jgi:hypothetical protein